MLRLYIVVLVYGDAKCCVMVLWSMETQNVASLHRRFGLWRRKMLRNGVVVYGDAKCCVFT